MTLLWAIHCSHTRSLISSTVGLKRYGLGYDSSQWMQFYVGFGPIDNMNSNFEVCVMIWQSASYSHSDWSIIASSWTTLYDSPDYYNVELGIGMQGTVNAIYMN